MKILMAASEAVPFSKTGGLADVAGSLSQKIAELGNQVLLVSPQYQSIPLHYTEKARKISLFVPLGSRIFNGQLRVFEHKNVTVALVDCPEFFNRPGLYGEAGKDYKDNDLRFAFFAKSVLEASKALKFKPDIIHSHDWQTGLICAFLKSPRADEFFGDTKTVFTIHNLAYQGNFPPESVQRCGVDPLLFNSEGLEFYHQMSFMKSGLVFSDLLNTVSPTYAQEIQASSERGFGFEGLLSYRRRELYGILNGLDTEIWDPQKDAALEKKYSSGNYPEGKSAAKKEIFLKGNLSVPLKTPLIGIVSRLDRQKGLDIALEALKDPIENIALAVIGTGDPALEQAFSDFAKKFPHRVYFHPRFDEAFAHKIYAGSDIFLMPSRFEPCGLGQMIAMRYGSVPVVSRTGGLADTVFESPGEKKNGFLSEPGDAKDLKAALGRALKAYALPSWEDLILSGMDKDFSWEKSAKDYLKLYQLAQNSNARVKTF